MGEISRFVVLSALSVVLSTQIFGQGANPPGAVNVGLTSIGRFSRGPQDLDKASRKQLENLRRVSEEDRERYAELLKGENTGIFKLFPDNGCTAKNLIRVDGDCEGFVPDSSAYTFRTDTYERWSGDIFLFKNHFSSKTFFSQPIMVLLGDVPIEEVTDAHPAVKSITALQPALSPADAELVSYSLAGGVELGGYTFAATSRAGTEMTYLFRQISFNVSGKVPKQKMRTRFGVFEVDMLKRSLKYQERKDTIFAFRVVRRDEDGGLTIVWKQLSRKDAPAIVFASGDKIPRFFWRLPTSVK